MTPVGYAHLISLLKLPVRLAGKPAAISASVNRRVETDTNILFPTGVALTDSPLGHLEFALRHEGIDLAVIEAAFAHIEPAALIQRLRENPNGEYIRRAAFLWEWLTGKELSAGVTPTGRYVELFSSEQYVTARNPRRHPTYRITDNALGNRHFCPVVGKQAYPGPEFLEQLLAEAASLSGQSQQRGHYERAIHYLYLSETRGSFAIERETPSASKEARFIQLLRQAGETRVLTEERLVAIQNAAVRDDYSREASYRTRQNWLENHAGRITFFPHPVEGLRETMAGWEAFLNDESRGIDPLIRAACASFGFVYLHPFMDGNGRLHRYIIHHVLAHSGLVSPDMIIPVSAVIMKHITEYHQVLTGFSEPVTQLWDYLRHDDGPQILHTPGCGPYRYFQADREVTFLGNMLQEAIKEEIPRELRFLQGYDAAYERIDAEFDLPQKEIALLIRLIHGNSGQLSKRKRTQFERIPDETVTRIEQIVNETFENA